MLDEAEEKRLHILKHEFKGKSLKQIAQQCKSELELFEPNIFRSEGIEGLLNKLIIDEDTFNHSESEESPVVENNLLREICKLQELGRKKKEWINYDYFQNLMQILVKYSTLHPKIIKFLKISPATY